MSYNNENNSNYNKEDVIYCGSANNKETKTGVKFFSIYMGLKDLFNQETLNEENLKMIFKPKVFEALNKSKMGNYGLKINMWGNKNKRDEKDSDFTLKVDTYKPSAEKAKSLSVDLNDMSDDMF